VNSEELSLNPSAHYSDSTHQPYQLLLGTETHGEHITDLRQAQINSLHEKDAQSRYISKVIVRTALPPSSLPFRETLSVALEHAHVYTKSIF